MGVEPDFRKKGDLKSSPPDCVNIDGSVVVRIDVDLHANFTQGKGRVLGHDR